MLPIHLKLRTSRLRLHGLLIGEAFFIGEGFFVHTYPGWRYILGNSTDVYHTEPSNNEFFFHWGGSSVLSRCQLYVGLSLYLNDIFYAIGANAIAEASIKTRCTPGFSQGRCCLCRK